MKNKNLNLANAITVSRIIFMPFLFMFVIQENRNAFLAGYIIVGSTDFLDGFIARKLNQVTKLGKMLDSIADIFFYIPTAWFLMVLYPQYIMPNVLWLIGAFLVYFTSFIVSIIKVGKPIMMHTSLLRFNAVLVFAMVILSYFMNTTYLLTFILINFMIGFFESILIFIRFGHVDVDTKSIFTLIKRQKLLELKPEDFIPKSKRTL
jgi:phosphatidylglycerophosphate synthase